MRQLRILSVYQLKFCILLPMLLQYFGVVHHALTPT